MELLQTFDMRFYGFAVSNQLSMFSKSGHKSVQTKDACRPKINYGVGVLTLGRASWLNSSWRFLTVLNTRVLQANGSQRIIDRSLWETESVTFLWFYGFIVCCIWMNIWISYPNTCSCPFFTPSRKPCNSRARLASTNFSLMQASKHQENYKRIRANINIECFWVQTIWKRSPLWYMISRTVFECL